MISQPESDKDKLKGGKQNKERISTDFFILGFLAFQRTPQISHVLRILSSLKSQFSLSFSLPGSQTSHNKKLMPISDEIRLSLIPSFLYCSSTKPPTGFDKSRRNANHHKVLPRSPSVSPPSSTKCSAGDAGVNPGRILIPAPKEKIEMYSPAFYGACTMGGIFSCGLTHTAVTPLDLVKCVKGLSRGWVPTLLGYSAQGACKFGFYEFFKKYYSDLAGPEYASKYKTLIYLTGSASAEVIADIALCPMEAVKVRVQTQPGFARGLSDGLPKFLQAEGFGGLFKGLVPLWGRQIPYTMMKFASFETIVELLYKHAIPTPKDKCSKPLQLGVSFAGGYIAGVFCAIVSHPADNLVSFLNNAKGATVGDAVKKMGLWGLFTRGLPLRIVMIGTLTGAQWGIYDAFKVFVGLPTTGGGAPTPPPAKK
ncbi:hypothetical protein V6N13_146113 [Hibiscus sabdariffa]